MTDDLRTLALAEKRPWPFEEAQRVLARVGGPNRPVPPAKGHVLFETGYGPSGPPHIGTFGEVVRTSFVRRAFELLAPGVPTRLVCFSDDMDGMRKVPPNLPQQEMLKAHLGLPLSRVPDPFGTHESFAAHNNARLCAFLDGFGFQYEFVSSTETYRSGRFDAALRLMLERFDEVMALMLPTLGAERQQTYAPFLPISPATGRVLQVPILARDPAAGTITFRDEDGRTVEQPVTGGHAKLQWKPDWGMRWFALGVDYEMSGKDLIDSVKLASEIVRVLGGTPPEGMTYELFLDEGGQKISKTKGNGISIEEWLELGPPESLALFMYQQPRRAKRLYFDVIPRTVDDWLAYLDAFQEQDASLRLNNPAWHIHAGVPPAGSPVDFGLLLNLAGVANTEDPAVLWGFLRRYDDGLTPEGAPLLDRLMGYALRYYQRFVKPTKRYRAPTETDRAALHDLDRTLAALPPGADAEAIQFELFEVGKRHPYPGLRDWFRAVYETCLGQEQGPRLGSFIALYGVAETRALIAQALAGDLAALVPDQAP